MLREMANPHLPDLLSAETVVSAAVRYTGE